MRKLHDQMAVEGHEVAPEYSRVPFFWEEDEKHTGTLLDGCKRYLCKVCLWPDIMNSYITMFGYW